MAFLAGVRGTRRVFVDDRPIDYGPDWVVGWPLALSRDGGTVACTLEHLKTRRACVGIDGRRGEEFDRVGTPALSSDGKTLAYRAQEGPACFAVVNGRKGPAFDQMIDPVVSEDGSTVAYAAARAGRWSLRVGDRESPLPERPFQLFISRDGASVGYVLLEPGAGRTARVVAHGLRGDAFSVVGRPRFSPDGKTFAYAADDGYDQSLVVRRRRIPVAGRITDPVFSPDGRRVGYGARIGRELWWKVVPVD